MSYLLDILLGTCMVVGAIIAMDKFILPYMARYDKLALCPDCGEPWPKTETIRADGSLGCPCRERLATPFCDGGCDGMNEEWFAVSDCCSICGLPVKEH